MLVPTVKHEMSSSIVPVPKSSLIILACLCPSMTLKVHVCISQCIQMRRCSHDMNVTCYNSGAVCCTLFHFRYGFCYLCCSSSLQCTDEPIWWASHAACAFSPIAPIQLHVHPTPLLCIDEPMWRLAMPPALPAPSPPSNCMFSPPLAVHR